MSINPLSSHPFTGHLNELLRLERAAQGLDQGRPEAAAAGSFAATLKNSLAEVNQLQQQADQRITAVTTGRSQDTLGAIVALQRADMSMQLLAQVRNKALKAYEEIIKSPI
ncbi:MAG: flagellar hook-basal body complex protein FliE [Deltaproteobacteria bacterium]|nr:flagellar hook-basal body complex protein FliE [Deltaproteobacteria bacterium]